MKLSDRQTYQKFNGLKSVCSEKVPSKKNFIVSIKTMKFHYSKTCEDGSCLSRKPTLEETFLSFRWKECNTIIQVQCRKRKMFVSIGSFCQFYYVSDLPFPRNYNNERCTKNLVSFSVQSLAENAAEDSAQPKRHRNRKSRFFLQKFST